MRYIRTKNGIEKALYGEEFHEGKSYFYKTDYQWCYGDHYRTVKTKTYAKNGTTRIADNIEELCDMFVANNRTFYTINETLPELKCCDDAIIYGAIWTEWGLKYVAKMNEKGRFEFYESAYE